MIDAYTLGPVEVSALPVGPLAVGADTVGPLILSALTIEPPAPVVVVYLTTQLGATITTQSAEPLEVAA